MEHRRRSASVRTRCQIPSGYSDQSDRTKTACQAFLGHTFRWWKVNSPLPIFPYFLRIIGSFDRFLPQSVAEKYDLDIPDYQGVDQIAEVSGTSTDVKKREIIGLAERQG